MPAKRDIPAQKQTRQPGRERLMHPAPDYAPRFPGSGRLKNKAVIITGGDSGIGRACSVLFAREGAKIAIVYLEEDGDAEETRRVVEEEEGGEALLVKGDIGLPSFCADAARRAAKAFGGIDVLVNNAARQYPQEELSDISPDQLKTTFRTNVFGYFHMSQAVLPHLKRGAAIVNTASVTAYRGSPHLIDYAASRGAIVAFTRSLADSLAGKGIRVNAVAPGPIWTPLIPASFKPAKVKDFGADQPLGRAGQPNEVASCHLFLACEESSYMTGQVLHPNGGEVVGG